MASTDEVQRLAALARIAVTEEESARFAAEFDGILGYVGQLESLSVDGLSPTVPLHRNILREDGIPTEPGSRSAEIIAQFPDKEGDSLKVKQIIAND